MPNPRLRVFNAYTGLPIAGRGRACLVGPGPTTERLFADILHHEGYDALYATASLSLARLAEGAPTFLLIDFVDLDLDQLETLRQVRFLLPRSIIAVYSKDSSKAFALECHLAGANCMLAKGSGQKAMAAGIHRAIEGGCYTDPNFGADELGERKRQTSGMPAKRVQGKIGFQRRTSGTQKNRDVP